MKRHIQATDGNFIVYLMAKTAEFWQMLKQDFMLFSIILLNRKLSFLILVYFK